MLTECGDGVASIKRCHRDLSSDDVKKMTTKSGRNRLKSDLEDSIAALRTRAVQELHELQVILVFVDSRVESIEQFLNNLANQPDEANIDDLESNNESVDTPLVSPFLHSDNDSDDSEVLNELSEYENAGVLR
ncbi:hypothetical protein Tco_0623423 [Tanacetum coccineum]